MHAVEESHFARREMALSVKGLGGQTKTRDIPDISRSTGVAGLEPTTLGFGGRCSTTELHPHGLGIHPIRMHSQRPTTR